MCHLGVIVLLFTNHTTPRSQMNQNNSNEPICYSLTDGGASTTLN